MLILVFAGADPGYTCTDDTGNASWGSPEMTTSMMTTSSMLMSNVSGNSTEIPECTADNKACPGIKFDDELTSIVTEVSGVENLKRQST